MIETTTIILIVVQIGLLACSAFFSGSETILFGLTADDRWNLRRAHPASAAIVDRLLASPRRLLLTVLMANMTVNSIYFAAGTVMLAGVEIEAHWQVILGLWEVVGLVLLGEVLPKMIGNSLRLRLAPAVVRPILVVHTIANPIRSVVERLIFAPLNRISAPALAAAGPTHEELGEVLRAAGIRNDITPEEEALFARLLVVRRKRVRDVMTHRTEIRSISRRATRDDVLAVCRRSRLKRLPVIENSIDQLAGVLDVRAYLLDPRGAQTPLEAHTRPAAYIPEVASLEQLLDIFRKYKSSLLVAVDEFGGTAGIVALEDAIEEIVGDIVAADETVPDEPVELGGGKWRIDGTMAAGALCTFFRVPIDATRASTVAGVAAEVLGELPLAGREFDWEGLHFLVEPQVHGKSLRYLVSRAHDVAEAQGGGGT